MKTTIEQDERFDEIHEALASVGVCDGTGGSEYTRVKRQWIEQGRPHRIASFIEIQSNNLFDEPDAELFKAINEIKSKQDRRIAAIRMGEPVRPEQRLRLHQAVTRSKGQVGIHHVDPAPA